jgi:hypothetical protein
MCPGGSVAGGRFVTCVEYRWVLPLGGMGTCAEQLKLRATLVDVTGCALPGQGGRPVGRSSLPFAANF